MNAANNTDIEILLTYFPELSAVQQQQFSLLPQLYKSWNEKINVISRKDIDHLLVHHVLHSLSIAKVISFTTNTRIIDVGTGGGFPGIPLAIMFPETNFLLIDSIGKKINVVNEIIASLKLENVNALKSRAEDVRGNFDFVVSRAVAPLQEICKWTRHLIQPGGKNNMKNGWLFLKGGDLSEEMVGANSRPLVFEINNYFKEDFFNEKRIIYLPYK